MKTIAIAVIVAGMAMSCTESMQPVPEPDFKANGYDTTIPITVTPMLYMDVPDIGVEIKSRPHMSYDLVEFHNGTNMVIGKTWVFANEDTSLTATVCWIRESNSITLFTGRILETTYIVNTQDSSMNICHGPQGIPVVYSLLMNNSANLPTP